MPAASARGNPPSPAYDGDTPGPHHDDPPPPYEEADPNDPPAEGSRPRPAKTLRKLRRKLAALINVPRDDPSTRIDPNIQVNRAPQVHPTNNAARDACQHDKRQEQQTDRRTQVPRRRYALHDTEIPHRRHALRDAVVRPDEAGDCAPHVDCPPPVESHVDVGGLVAEEAAAWQEARPATEARSSTAQTTTTRANPG